ncbi:MAG: cytochrome d ubiquinol oxidase subunit II [Chloroflexota bacterium]|nr:cytochrome d ubiquinol oxidase subunit II [Chloroflexota bacterium]
MAGVTMQASATTLWPELIGAVGLLAVLAYAVLAGADFGAGVWDLLAYGPRAGARRRAIAEAMGPVWEANHVWLIFVIVLLFSCFPSAYAALSVAFFVPFHLILVGVILRGASFVFRAHGREAAGTSLGWGRVFGIASAVTPLLLGACLGALSAGHVRVEEGAVLAGSTLAWLRPFPIVTGFLALAVCAYLAAVYLTIETEGQPEVQADFRRRALWVWCIAGALSVAAIAVAAVDAPRLWGRLTAAPAAGALLAGALLAPASGAAMWRRRYAIARVLAVGQVVVLLSGWALAQWPYIIYPDVTLHGAAAPVASLRAVALTLPFGLGLLLPSLWLLFAVFKGRNPAPASGTITTAAP